MPNKKHLKTTARLLALLLTFKIAFYAAPASAQAFLGGINRALGGRFGLVGRDPTTYILNAGNLLTGLVNTLAFAALAWGAITYITSLGEEGKVSKGKRVILYALIGLVISYTTRIIMQAVICGVLGNVTHAICAASGAWPAWSATLISNTISNFINVILIGPAATIAFGALVGGGYLYMTAGGDEGRISRAKNIVIYALLGLLIIGISGIIINVILTL
jgi:hypothetical protein